MKKYFTNLDNKNEIYCYNQNKIENFNILENIDLIAYGGYGLVTGI